MHYKNGREAKNGDIVLALYCPPIVGVLFGAKAPNGSDCNGNLAPVTSGSGVSYADLKNCLHIDDITAASIPDSTQPPPVDEAPTGSGNASPA